METELKIEAVLFDLDNTLILFDEKEFYNAYSYKLSQHFKDLLSPQEFVQKLMISTQIMTNNDGKLNNADYFIEDFSDGLNIDKNDLWQRFDNFYSTEFVQFKKLMQPILGARELILKILEMNLKVVIASNPMLPENVQQLRLNWAGLEGITFDLITHLKNSTYCKPNLNYYHEICDKIDVIPQNCLMVGNDTFNDMIAAKTGMKTFLVTDSQNNSVEVSRELAGLNKVEMPEPNHRGKIDELLSLLGISE
jgi:FMN phosphatase YigB (HAD superfamily)